MRTRAVGRKAEVFAEAQDGIIWDIIPKWGGVRLLSAGGKFAQSDGAERLWPGLWDTGGIITVIPRIFVDETGLEKGGRTKGLTGFDGQAGSRTHEWFSVQVGLPGLPLLYTRAIAPVDNDPSRPRKHITLGRDVIFRLTVRWSSNVPLEGERACSDAPRLDWDYS